MPAHRFSLPGWTGPDPADPIVAIEGEEARHAARVKRLEPGEPVEVLSGEGLVGIGEVAGIERVAKGAWRLLVRVERTEAHEPVRPMIEVCCAPPKGARFEEMVDQLSQVGAASWRALDCTRAGEKPPREGKLDRARRVAMEAAKQCGRAWTLRIDEPLRWREALAGEDGLRIVAADASGEGVRTLEGLRGAERVRLLVGPEGGWTPDELDEIRRAGAGVVRFGPHIMRIETAAVVGCSGILSVFGP